ncbi:GerAB/ArcD/ProY family transporter [Neobacillus sp. D3-1R]|uniref:GerAB/ArcD/ProY family transporter n=1 Tax=Neobacillus sp. D3-1R TaxID=3445778 RepID=UPI003FA1620D
MERKMDEKISLWQLFLLIFIFETGSAVVVGIAGEAKKDAWIALLIATVIGIIIILYYFFIIEKSGNKNLFEILEFCFGKYISKLFIFLYIVYFFYIASRVLRDFGELMVSTIFEKTPIEFISITMMFLIAYFLILGIEILGRTSEIFIPYIAIFIVFVGLGILLSNELDIANLLPILGDGFKPVIKSVFPSLIVFPFGELIVFTAFIPRVTKIKKGKTVAAISVFLSGLLLVYTTVIQLATLGDNIRNRSNFPMLSAAREISLLNFIERVDLIIVFIVMFGIIVKVTIFFYGGLVGLEKVFNVPYRQFVIPMALLISFSSIIISKNFAEHIEEGLKVVPLYLHLPLQLGLPLCLFPIIWIKKKRQKK